MTAVMGVLQRARVRGGDRKNWVRIFAALLITGILASVLMFASTSPASAKEQDPENCAAEDNECENWSFYNLASRASTYFSNANTPGKEDSASLVASEHDNGPIYDDITYAPSNAGDFLGFADEADGFLGWLFSPLSGSSQAVEYSSFENPRDAGLAEDRGENLRYSGLKHYAYFGAANTQLGFTSMSSNLDILGQMIHGAGGALMFLFYGLAVGVGWLFGFFIDILQLLNPFAWFYKAIEAISPTFANGMVQHEGGGDYNLGAFSGLADTIAGWYGVLYDISINILIPIFLGVLIFSLMLFRRMDRGSAIKKIAIRTVFIVVGLPLLGSMYTQVLDKMDTSDAGYTGASKVVLSTYVDYENWAMQERFVVPSGGVIEWDESSNKISSDAELATRKTALAINVASNPDFAGMGTLTGGSAETSWTQSQPDLETTCRDDEDAEIEGCIEHEDTDIVGATMNLLGRYMGSAKIEATDFESSAKDAMYKSGVDHGVINKWFQADGYDNAGFDFGEAKGDAPAIQNHPVFAVSGDTGLTPTQDGSVVSFSSKDVEADCGAKVSDAEGNPLACNMSPLAAYNYMNTSFDDSSMTMYSAKKITSGGTRELPDSVSQVGSGLMSFMYWFNALIMLVCVAVLGLFYALGMIFSAVKRTFGLIAAIPFATLGAMAGIAKVIIYSAALILEVIGTLFLYNFVSEILLSLPGIVEGPMTGLFSWGPFKVADAAGNGVLGGLAVLLATLFTTLLLIVATIAMLRVRGSVLKAINEAVTKLVDRFLDTGVTPPSNGGMVPAMAGGLGAGAGMALGNKMMNGGGGGGSPRVGSAQAPKGSSGPTNAGGTNAGGNAVGGSNVNGQLPPGNAGGSNGPGGPNDPNGPGGAGSGDGGPGGHGTVGARGQIGQGGANGGGMSGSDGRGGSGQGGLNGREGQRSGTGADGADGQARDQAPSEPGKDGVSGENGKRGQNGQVGQMNGPGSTTGSTTGAPGQETRDQDVANRVNEQGGLSGSTPKDVAGSNSQTNLGGNNGNATGTGVAGAVSGQKPVAGKPGAKGDKGIDGKNGQARSSAGGTGAQSNRKNQPGHRSGGAKPGQIEQVGTPNQKQNSGSAPGSNGRVGAGSGSGAHFSYAGPNSSENVGNRFTVERTQNGSIPVGPAAASAGAGTGAAGATSSKPGGTAGRGAGRRGGSGGNAGGGTAPSRGNRGGRRDVTTPDLQASQASRSTGAAPKGTSAPKSTPAPKGTRPNGGSGVKPTAGGYAAPADKPRTRRDARNAASKQQPTGKGEKVSPEQKAPSSPKGSRSEGTGRQSAQRTPKKGAPVEQPSRADKPIRDRRRSNETGCEHFEQRVYTDGNRKDNGPVKPEDEEKSED